MKDAIKDILSSYKGMVSEALIAKYVRGQASREEARHLELLMHDDPFLADAVEGLKDGDYASHESNIDTIKASLYRKKPGFLKISITSVAVAASLVLGCYWAVKFSSFGLKQEEASAPHMAMDSVEVHKETKIITLQKPEPLPEEETKVEKENAEERVVAPVATDVRKPDSYYNSNKKELAIASPATKQHLNKAVESSETYVSKDKSHDKKATNVLNEEDIELDMVDEAPATISRSDAFEEQMPKVTPKFVKSLNFNQLAINTKEFLSDMAPHPEGKSEEYKITAKRKASKPNCENCPNKEVIAEKNTVLDTIATHKAAYLYEMGAYEEAAKWYARNADVHSKVMAGLSYLQAGDTSACRSIEAVLLKSNVPAYDLLKALRMSYLDKNFHALNGFQKLIDNKSIFKELAEKNKQVISTK